MSHLSFLNVKKPISSFHHFSSIYNVYNIKCTILGFQKIFLHSNENNSKDLENTFKTNQDKFSIAYQKRLQNRIDRINRLNIKNTMNQQQKNRLKQFANVQANILKQKIHENAQSIEEIFSYRVQKSDLKLLIEETQLNPKRIEGAVKYHIEGILFPESINNQLKQQVQTLFNEKHSLDRNDIKKLSLEFLVSRSKLHYYINQTYNKKKNKWTSEIIANMKEFLKSKGILNWKDWTNYSQIKSTEYIPKDQSNQCTNIIENSIENINNRDENCENKNNLESKTKLLHDIKKQFQLNDLESIQLIKKSLSQKTLSKLLQNQIKSFYLQSPEQIREYKDIQNKFNISSRQAKYLWDKLQLKNTHKKWTSEKKKLLQYYLQSKKINDISRRHLSEILKVSPSQLNRALNYMKNKSKIIHSTPSTRYIKEDQMHRINKNKTIKSYRSLNQNDIDQIKDWLKNHSENETIKSLSDNLNLQPKQVYNAIYLLREPNGKITIEKKLKIVEMLSSKQKLETEDIDYLKNSLNLSRYQIYQLIKSISNSGPNNHKNGSNNHISKLI